MTIGGGPSSLCEANTTAIAPGGSLSHARGSLSDDPKLSFRCVEGLGLEIPINPAHKKLHSSSWAASVLVRVWSTLCSEAC